jgi:hypothetical protein
MNSIINMVLSVAMLQLVTGRVCAHQWQDCPVNSSSLLQKVFQDTSDSVSSRRSACSVDVVLVLDRSRSVGDSYATLRTAATNFVVKLQKKSEATNGDSRIGLLSYGATAEWHSKLTKDFSSVISKIGAMPALEWWTSLDVALDMATLELGPAGPSELPKSQRVALVISDGESNGSREPISRAILAATNLKQHARLYIVGIEAGDTAFMEKMASEPTKENYHALGDFAGLTDSFIDTLIEGVCGKPTPTTPASPAPTPMATPTVPSPSPRMTPAPPAPSTPTPRVPPVLPAPAPMPDGRKKDTGASCRTMNTCFERLRGDTFCNQTTKTCQCSNFPREYVFERDIPLSAKWNVCRKSEDDLRGEENSLKWMGLLSADILGYWFR